MNQFLNLQIKNSAKNSLAKHLSISIDEDESPDDPAEFVFEGKSYSIKISKPIAIAKDKRGLVWDFDLRSTSWINGRNIKSRNESPSCDFFLLAGVQDNELKKVFLMKASDVPSSHVRISVSGNSKYYKYAI